MADSSTVSTVDTQNLPSEATKSEAWRPMAPRLPLVPQLRERLLDRTAAWLASHGITRIALYPGGRHSRAILRQPWLAYGIEVVAILDDTPSRDRIAGVPVRRPADAVTRPDFQALVLSSTEHEEKLGPRARSTFAGTGVRVVSLYQPDDSMWDEDSTIERLIARGLSLSDARWLVHNRGERHDALLPIIPAARTELHARRYELAGEIARERGADRIADLACGTGYGSRLLATIGNAKTEGVDLDPGAIDYAQRHYSGDGQSVFHIADACHTPLASNTFDLAASFETIEHIENATGLLAELHRVLKPGGQLVMSTPNRVGPTPYHVHDFGLPEFSAIVESCFQIERWIGQNPTDEVYTPDLPPGMWPIDTAAALEERWQSGGGKPQFLIAVARKPHTTTRPNAPNHVNAIVSWLRDPPSAG
mgnify:CR=1 FL=1